MMVKNESKYLRRCLQSLQQIRDVVESELIIIDTGSIDDTLEIAMEFTDKVYFHKWNNNFSEMRNKTIAYSTGDWYFFIDGDEIVNSPNELIDFFVSGKYNDNNTACVTIKSYMSSKDKENFSIFLAPRLFKKDKDFCFEGPIHEQPNMKSPIIVVNSEIIHYGYIKDDKALMERKFIRNVEILKKQLKLAPEDIQYLYQLSASYGMHGDKEEELQQIQRAFDIVKLTKIDYHKYIYIYTQIINSYLVNGKYKEAENICLEIIREDSMYIDLFFFIAKAQLMMNKNEDATKNYKTYLKKRNNIKNDNNMKNIFVAHFTIGKFEEAYFDLSILYERQGNYEESLKYSKKILSENALPRAFNQIMLLHVKVGKYKELKNYYDNEILIKNNKFKDIFINNLESCLSHIKKDKIQNIYKVFSEGNSEYALLNKIRVNGENHCEKYFSEIQMLDFNNLPDYYSCILYYMMSCKISIIKVLSKVNDMKIKAFFSYMLNLYEDLGIKLYNYSEEFRNIQLDINEVRIIKLMTYYVLISKELKRTQYKEVFDFYIKYGWIYLIKTYSEDVICRELVNYMKDEEDLFLMYMAIAIKNKNDKTVYIRNLEKALNANRYMKKGIDILQEETKEDSITKSKEIEVYKIKVL